MEYKYPEGLEFTIKNVDRAKIKSNWIFYDDCQNNCECKGYLSVGQKATIKHHFTDKPNLAYYLDLGNGYVSDWFSEEEIEFLAGGKENLESKPPLGVMPIHIFERQRIQELSRALYEYIEYGSQDYELLEKWSEELKDRIWTLKNIQEENN